MLLYSFQHRGLCCQYVFGQPVRSCKVTTLIEAFSCILVNMAYAAQGLRSQGVHGR